MRLAMFALFVTLAACSSVPTAPPSNPSTATVESSAAPVGENPTPRREPKAAQPDPFWNAVMSRFSVSFPEDDPRIQAEIQRLKKTHVLSNQLAGRGRVLLPMIVHVVHQRDLPAELAFVAAIESEYNPAADRAGNGGMWQMRVPTAKMLGLKTGKRHDERFDPVRSTHAALDYLQTLHGIFDDWLLALVAYNIGDGHLKRILATTGNRSVWTLPLPSHTTRHMVKMAAVWSIVANPERYGFNLPTMDGPAELTEVSLARKTSVKQIAQRYGLDPAALALLNHGRNANGLTRMWLPKSVEASVSSGETRAARGIPAKYRVARGDTLTAIAQRFTTTVASLRALNGLRTDRLRVGQSLRLR